MTLEIKISPVLTDFQKVEQGYLRSGVYLEHKQENITFAIPVDREAKEYKRITFNFNELVRALNAL